MYWDVWPLTLRSHCASLFSTFQCSPLYVTKPIEYWTRGQASVLLLFCSCRCFILLGGAGVTSSGAQGLYLALLRTLLVIHKEYQVSHVQGRCATHCPITLAPGGQDLFAEAKGLDSIHPTTWCLINARTDLQTLRQEQSLNTTTYGPKQKAKDIFKRYF